MIVDSLDAFKVTMSIMKASIQSISIKLIVTLFLDQMKEKSKLEICALENHFGNMITIVKNQ